MKLSRVNVLSVVFVMLFCFSAGALGQQVRTACEKSGFKRYCNHDEMMQFLKEVQAGSDEMLFSTYGKSVQGRELVYAVLSRPLVTNPFEAMTSGKPIVILDAAVHGMEHTLRESNMILIRELATKGTKMNDLLDKLVVIMVPCLNPDGTEIGKRSNANGSDLNRDYIKLDEPEIGHYVGDMLQKWHPHLQVGGHNGGAYPYNQAYLAPSNAAADQTLTQICDKEIFPLIDKNMEAAGYKSFYYASGDKERWRVGSSSPRIFRNYGGMSNYVSIVFETGKGLANVPDIKSGVVAYKSILEYCAANPKKLMDVVEKARLKTIELGQNAQGQIAVQMKYVPEDYKVSYLIAEKLEGDKKVITKVTGAKLMKKPVATKTRPRPYAYVLEAKAQKVIDLLKRHNITVETLQKDTKLDIEAYVLKSIEHKKQHNHPRSTVVTVEEKTVRKTEKFPMGTYIVRTGQVMGRIICHMLEPETPDNVIVWNTMDDLLGEPGSDSLIPIYRITSPIAMPTMLSE